MIKSYVSGISKAVKPDDIRHIFEATLRSQFTNNVPTLAVNVPTIRSYVAKFSITNIRKCVLYIVLAITWAVRGG